MTPRMMAFLLSKKSTPLPFASMASLCSMSSSVTLLAFLNFWMRSVKSSTAGIFAAISPDSACVSPSFSMISPTFTRRSSPVWDGVRRASSWSVWAATPPMAWVLLRVSGSFSTYLWRYCLEQRPSMLALLIDQGPCAMTRSLNMRRVSFENE